jgi:hypothetical protein
MTTAEAGEVPCARIYRHLHGSPMLAGLPAHLVLVLLGLGCVGGFGVMTASTGAGVVAVGLVVVAWVVLAFIFKQDRVAVPLFLLRIRRRFPAVISSFTRGYARVVLVEDR